MEGEKETPKDETLGRLRARLSDRYEVERKLGAGGMAAVYLANDIKHDRQVAIKVLHPELAATIGGERFEREIRTAAKLQHPNILAMFDSGNADGLLFYVMPFVEGESLRNRLDRETQLPVDEAIQIALEVADALGHAHSKGIIHRDIKPDNVMLSGGHALVADLGIARASADSTEKLTSTGMSVGTPTYMAPEQAVGEAVGPTADLYSLGCMLYEMLAGEPPFTGKNGAMIMAKHAMEAVPSIRIVRPSVPEEVEQAILSAMGKLPADRPQSAAAFMEIFGMPMSQTRARRVSRVAGAYRGPAGAQTVLELPTPFWKQRWVAPVAVVAVVAVVAFGAFQVIRGGSEAAAAGGLDKSTIAVLYFDSPDTSLRYLADGLTEGLIENLTGVQGLRVISRSGSEQVRDDGLTTDSIAHLLEAGTLIQGEVAPDKGGLKVNVKIVDGTSGFDIDRKAFTLAKADLTVVRDSLAKTVAELIRKQVGTEVALASRAETRNSDAWSIVQRAEQIRKRGEASGDPEALDREFKVADALLAEAERLDGKWIRPVIARANLDYRRARLVRRDPVLVKPWIDSALKDIARAIDMNGANPDALELRGNLLYWGFLVGVQPDEAKANQDLMNAKTDLELATQKNPLQAGAWSSLSHLYNYTGGQIDIGMAAREAMKADAFLSNADQILDRLFISYYDQDNPLEAERWCSDSHRRFPRSFLWPRCSLYRLTMRDKAPDISSAWRLADTMVALSPERAKEMNRLRANMLVAAIIARAADSAKKSSRADLAKTLSDSAGALAERSVGNAEIDAPRELANTAAFVFTILGDRDRAIDHIALFLAANERKRRSFADDPGWWFRSIRDDPKFVRAVGRR